MRDPKNERDDSLSLLDELQASLKSMIGGVFRFVAVGIPDVFRRALRFVRSLARRFVEMVADALREIWRACERFIRWVRSTVEYFVRLGLGVVYTTLLFAAWGLLVVGPFLLTAYVPMLRTWPLQTISLAWVLTAGGASVAWGLKQRRLSRVATSLIKPAPHDNWEGSAYPRAESRSTEDSVADFPVVYSETAIALSGLVGTLLAGGFLVAINWNRLGSSNNARKTLVATVSFAVAMVFCLTLVASETYTEVVFLVVPPVSLAASLLLYRRQKNHLKVLEAAWRPASKWSALVATGLLGMFFWVTQGSTRMAVAYASTHPVYDLVVHEGSTGSIEIVFAGGVTREQALEVARALPETSFQDLVRVEIYRSEGGCRVSFTVPEGLWNLEGSVAWYRRLVPGFASVVGGFPIELEIVDGTGVVRLTEILEDGTVSAFGEAVVDDDSAFEVFPNSSVSDDQAKRLSRALTDNGLGKPSDGGKGSVYFSRSLLRDSEGRWKIPLELGPTRIGFCVLDGLWENPESVDALVKVVAKLPVDLIGPAVTLDLRDSDGVQRLSVPVTR